LGVVKEDWGEKLYAGLSKKKRGEGCLKESLMASGGTVTNKSIGDNWKGEGNK